MPGVPVSLEAMIERVRAANYNCSHRPIVEQSLRRDLEAAGVPDLLERLQELEAMDDAAWEREKRFVERHAELLERVRELEELIEDFVVAAGDVLPITGGWIEGYTVSERISSQAVALPEEWANAADALCRAHATLQPKPDRTKGAA